MRQQEETHIMENIIYNELITRGYSIDIGMVEIKKQDKDGKWVRKTTLCHVVMKMVYSLLVYLTSFLMMTVWICNATHWGRFFQSLRFVKASLRAERPLRRFLQEIVYLWDRTHSPFLE